MNWLTWRQHRIEVVIGTVLLALLCIWLLVDGLAARATYQTPEIATCLAQHVDTQRVECLVHFYRLLGDAAIGNALRPMSTSMPFWLPLLLAVFVGALLVSRERERKNNYVSWMQSVTRVRWLAVQLGWIASLTLLAFLVISLLFNWWSVPWVALSTDDPWMYYDQTGFVMVGFAFFGLMLGVAVGTMIGRIVPAMLLTVLLFFLFNLGMHSAYLYLIPPQSAFYPTSITQTGPAWGNPGDMTLYAGYADQQGHETGELADYCGFHITLQENYEAYTKLANQCIHSQHLQWKIVSQPSERIWLLQAVETALLLALALALVPFTFWWLTKRIR